MLRTSGAKRRATWQVLRRDRRRRSVRGVADWRCCWLARDTRSSSSTGRHSRATRSRRTRAPAGHRSARSMGSARRAQGERMPADPHVRVQLRPGHDRGHAGHRRPPVAYGPRRTVLDKLLVDAASEAGAEVREGFTVEDVVIEDGSVAGIRGHSKDGKHGHRARARRGRCRRTSLADRRGRPSGAVQRGSRHPVRLLHVLERTSDRRTLRDVYVRPERGWAVMPTNDDLTLVVCGWPIAEFEANSATSRATTSRCSSWSPSSPNGSATQSAKPHRRDERRELLPQAVRSGLGPRRRRRLQQGLHHSARHQRRIPRRGALHERARRVLQRRHAHSTTRWATTSNAGQPRAADVRANEAVGDARTATARAPAAHRCDGAETRMRWTTSAG